MSHPGWRQGRRRVSPRRLRIVEQLKAGGTSNRQIARRLGITEAAIRKLVGPAQDQIQQVIPLAVSPSPAPPATIRPEEPQPTPRPDSFPLSLDLDPTNRILDRTLARLGVIDDATPLFRDASAVPGAGVLIAIPHLVNTGIFDIARKLYGNIGPAFYGLRTTILALLVMALLRIKRPEALKERDPAWLGLVLGLDRAPEVKTLRRKLSVMASFNLARRFGEDLARRRVDQRGKLTGFLYVDGHVRVYHGGREIPKAHVARMRLCMPATTDYWVNDQTGDPLFVVTANANAGMVKMLPVVLDDVRMLVGDRRVTVVFDRGGWSPKLFRQILSAGFDILTYRKGNIRWIPVWHFVRKRARIDGRWVVFNLNDRQVRFLGGSLRLRQVTRMTDDGHQTPVITSRRDLSDVEVAYRMFERWRQENYFKYMAEEFLLDALVDYRVEPDDPTRTVPNPARRAMDKLVRLARTDAAKLEQAYGGAAIDNTEGRRPTMRGFKIAHGKIGKKLRIARRHLAALVARRRALPVRVPVRDIRQGTVIKLATERKHLTDIVKMVAYQAESDMLSLLRPHHARADQEGRTLLHELFASPADICVFDDEIRVTLAPLSYPHRTLAAQALCRTLNETTTRFPGTSMTLRFSVRSRPCIGLAFPGPTPRPRPVVSEVPKPDNS